MHYTPSDACGVSLHDQRRVIRSRFLPDYYSTGFPSVKQADEPPACFIFRIIPETNGCVCRRAGMRFRVKCFVCETRALPPRR